MEHMENLYSEKNTKTKSKRKGKDSVKTQRWAILSISSIPLVMTLGNSMLIPVLPAMEKALHISPFQTSMILTVYSIVAIILIPIAGFLSDHIGRKKVIIPSLIIAGIGGGISGFAAWKIGDAYWLILLGRALQGVGAAGAAPIVLPLVGDMFKNEDEVSSTLGLIETANTLGKVLSPILGAFLAGIIWYIPFLAFPFFCVMSILLMALLVKSPKTTANKIKFKKFLLDTKKVFVNNGRWLSAIFIIGGTLMFVLFGVLFYLSETLEKIYHIKDLRKGLVLALPLGALCLSSFITGKKIKENKVLMKWITFTGTVILTLAIFALSFSDALWFMITMFFICGVGIGVGLPSLDALITEGIEKEESGTISSLYSSMRFIGVAAGPPVIAILMENSGDWIFYLLGGFSVFAAIITLFAIKPDKETQKA
ncbi:MFS transporter [Bacillus sp. 1NLA3E]|uniref:MFS transporter n=1 Tax=Bacillus sp. 1NLA3E TaxID=666686 RepID=UPI000247E441|nr:MFS transporter [Bacillus sp. 1NLA3E]AGK54350.1 multidrug resistance protein MFS [Bacillus sp. 1NLA3E]